MAVDGDGTAPEAWLHARVPAAGIGAKAQRVLDYLVTNTATAGYVTAADLAESAAVSVSSVTRLAQQLGFDGWPHLQRELRARAMARLSMVGVSAAHGVTDTPFQSAVRRDAESLAEILRDVDERSIRSVAQTLQRATRITVTAMGSFSAVGQALSHNLLLAGYPVGQLVDRPATLANTVATMRGGDVLVVCSYWRHYRTVVHAAVAAHERGASIVVIADYLPDRLTAVADHIVRIPAEGTSFFASLTAPMAVQQGIVATLARLDPERTRAQIETAERMWGELELMVDPSAE